MYKKVFNILQEINSKQFITFQNLKFENICNIQKYDVYSEQTVS